jgi:hypothetical protein
MARIISLLNTDPSINTDILLAMVVVDTLGSSANRPAGLALGPDVHAE